MQVSPWLIWIIGFSLLACNREKTTDSYDEAVLGKLIVNVDNLRLKDKPGEKGEILAILPIGSVLEDLGSYTDYSEKYVLRGIEFDEPWILVRTLDSLEGWVYAGAISFDLSNPTAIADRLTLQRLTTLFGDSLAIKIDQYRTQFSSSQRSRDLAETYRTGLKLRDLMVKNLEQKLRFEDVSLAPDLFWIKDIVPGFVPQIVAEGSAYYFFFDYKPFLQKAVRTNGDEDDEFFELQVQLFPEDSVEYFFPKWVIQTWDYGGHSLLGRGIHLQILEEMDEILEDNVMFEPEIRKIQSLLLEDMTSVETTFWEPLDAIIKELDTIISLNLKSLPEADKAALATKRKMLENPAENGIQLDFKSGLREY